MNRRQFTAALSALLASPALPSMATAAASSPQNLKIATILARSHNRCSPAMLARLMQLDTATATGLHNTLLRQGVILSAPSGVAMAASPTNTHCVPIQALRPSNMLQRLAELKERATAFLDEEEPVEEEPSSE